MTTLKPQFARDDVKILGEKIVYDGYFKIIHKSYQHRLFQGGWSERLTRELFKRGNAVAILPYDPRTRQVVLIEQIRIGALEGADSPWLFEIPAGVVDAQDESLAAVASRELQEEAGLSASDFELIGTYYMTPGGSSEQITLFAAEVDATQAVRYAGEAEEHEDILVVPVSYEDTLVALKAGVIKNATTVMAIQWLALNLMES